MHSSLADNGEAHIAVPCASGFLPRIFKANYYDLGFPIHKQIFSKKGLHELARMHGFTIKKMMFRSYPETLIGTLLLFFLNKLGVTHESLPVRIVNSLIGRVFGLVFSPLVFFFDLIGQGDRIEIVMVKK